MRVRQRNAPALPPFFYCIERGDILVAVDTDAERVARDAFERSQSSGESYTVVARTNEELVPILNRALAKNDEAQ